MSINQFKSICLIGKAEKEYERGRIVKFDSTEKIKNKYGEECEIFKTFSKISMYGTIDIYTINVWTTEDYVNAINSLNQYDITYICPVDIFIDEYIWYKNVKIPKLKLLLENLNQNSSLIATYHHARNFLSLDDFIEESEKALDVFTKSCYDFIRRRGSSFLFCFNNLQSYDSANAILGVSLLNSSLGTYPNLDFGDTYFDMHTSDIYTDSIFFRRNILTTNSIENLVNHLPILSAEKYEEINIVKRYIEYSIQNCGLKGRKFDMKTVRDTIYRVMKDIKEKHYIKNFYINSIDYNITNSVELLIDMTIIPNSTFESYRVRIEV